MAALFVLAVFWFISGAYCGEVAEQKGYSRSAWAFGGFLFGFIALIAAAGLPDRKLRKYLRLIGEKQNAIDPQDELDDFEDAQKEVKKINKKYDNLWDRDKSEW